MRRRSGFVLVRRTGFRSGYSLASVYPSYRKGLHYQGSRGEWVAPIRLDLQVFGRTLDLPVRPALIRFPSWLARKIRRLDENGQAHRPPMTLAKAEAIVDGLGWQRRGKNRAHFIYDGSRAACGIWITVTPAPFADELPTPDVICRSCVTELRTAQGMASPTLRSTS